MLITLFLQCVTKLSISLYTYHRIIYVTHTKQLCSTHIIVTSLHFNETKYYNDYKITLL